MGHRDALALHGVQTLRHSWSAMASWVTELVTPMEHGIGVVPQLKIFGKVPHDSAFR